jgi:hypothetical protein
MKPRISDYRRRLWKRHPMLRPGVSFRPDQMQAIYDAIAGGDTYQAQQLILKGLRSEFDGPRTVARQRGRRKILVAR